ncbi:MAG TPA: SPW repeat protein, partial [Ramlibacter sp.]
MKHSVRKSGRWQYAAMAAAGLWLAVSPWSFGYRENASALAACVGFGVALASLALGSLLKPRPWEHWLAAVAGLVIASAPWLLGFAAEAAAARNAEAVGLV